MFVNEISHPDGTSRMLECNVVCAAVYLFKAKFDCTDTKMDQNDIPLFCGRKCTTASSFRKELVNKTAAVSCAKGQKGFVCSR